MKEPLLEPVMFGGGMVETVTDTGFRIAEGYQKYEAGTPNIGGGIGLGIAADYLQRIGMEKIQRYEETLTNGHLRAGKDRARSCLRTQQHHPPDRGSLFHVDGMHPH